MATISFVRRPGPSKGTIQNTHVMKSYWTVKTHAPILCWGGSVTKGAIMTAAPDGGHVVAIQVGDARPEVNRDMAVADCVEVISRADERLGERLRMAEQRLTAIREEIVTDPDMAVEYYLLQRAQSRTDEALSGDLEDFAPEDHRKRVDQYRKYSVIGSALLYRDAGFSGGSKFFTVTWPNFKWWPYKFNDKASSAKAWGGNILFQNTWYGGRRLYLVGLPYVEFDDLSVFDFNDRASSFVSLP